MHRLESLFKSHQKPRTIVLTGAGISADSGLKTFRDSDGLWENHHIEDVATPHGFLRNPQLVYKFYNERRLALFQALPNEGHYALKRLEDYLGDEFLLVTQNVDDLHERAGSLRLMHIHGELLKARCMSCAEVYSWTHELDGKSQCHECRGSLRPHIVWFYEEPFYLDEIYEELNHCQLFISIGTSGQVYPAASFSEIAKAAGALTVEINPHETSKNFDIKIPKKTPEAMREIFRFLNKP